MQGLASICNFVASSVELNVARKLLINIIPSKLSIECIRYHEELLLEVSRRSGAFV